MIFVNLWPYFTVETFNSSDPSYSIRDSKFKNYFRLLVKVTLFLEDFGEVRPKPIPAGLTSVAPNDVELKIK